MPTRHPLPHALPKSASRTYPRQLESQAQGVSGNACAFSIPGWPPRFQSRTCDPDDTCFIGTKGEEAKRSHAPVPGSQTTVLFKPKHAHPYRKGAFVLRKGSVAWRIWDAVKRAGELSTNQLVEQLDLLSSGVSNRTRPLVEAGVLVKRKLEGRGAQCAYSLGKRAVEVGA